MPLSPDEGYYWVWSRALAPGYLDHPPMVALWIRAGTALLGDGVLGVRLLAPFSAALGSLLLVRAGEDLLPSRDAGLVAAALLNATLLFGAGAVTMTPDTPLLFFWTLALFALARLVATGRPGWWLLAGAAIGLAMASKYTAVLLAFGTLAWAVGTPSVRPWLRRKQPWLAALLALAIFSPVLWWNAGHGWVSFAKQGGRAGVFAAGRALQFLGELLGGQVGLATPLVFLLCAAGLGLAVRRLRTGEAGWTLLAALAWPSVVLFVVHAVGDRVQANWPAVLYPAAVIAAAGLEGRWRRLVRPGVALGLGLTALAWVQATLAPLPLPARYDPTLARLGGWPDLAAAVEAARLDATASYVASDSYGEAALLARLLPRRDTVLAVEARWRDFDLPDAEPVIAGQPGLLIRSARRGDEPDPADWAAMSPIGTVSRGRDGMTAEVFRLYRVIGRDGAMPIVILPRPH